MRYYRNQGADEEAGSNEGGEYDGHFYFGLRTELGKGRGW